MATGALYNRWRGQVFADILGQDHITKTLQNQIRAGRVGHAYLFAGMRGTGKTSTARIMAKAVNCIGETDDPPCDRCHICRSIAEGRSLDLIEIDGASNRGIDEIRALRETVRFAPSEGRYKVYVIDEVHMLTNEAFNALLKTLEEPPPHVIFILCTTAPHRLPDTVLSRCQRFDFRRGTVSLLLKKLRMICEKEGIAIAPDALALVARRATGSFRDAESLLDQLAPYGDAAGEITLEQVRNILGTVSSTLVTNLVLSMITGDVPAGLRAINEAIDNGAEPRQFLREIIDQLRALLLLRVGGGDDQQTLSEQALAEIREVVEEHPFPVSFLVWAIKLFNEAASKLRYAVHLQVPLELAFIDAALRLREGAGQPRPDPGRARKAVPQGDAVEGPVPGSEEVAVATVEAAISVADASSATVAGGLVLAEEESEPSIAATPATAEAGPAVSGSSSDSGWDAVAAEQAGGEGTTPTRNLTMEEIRDRWDEVLAQVRQTSRRVEAVLRGARPIEVRGGVITIGCESPFHQGVLSEDKTCEIVGRAASQVLGVPCGVRCVLDSARGSVAGQFPRKNPARSESPEGPGSQEDARQKLLNHPAVKELQRRGGRISKVSPSGQDQKEDTRE